MSRDQLSIEVHVAKPIAQTAILIACVALLLYILGIQYLPYRGESQLVVTLALLVSLTAVLLTIMGRDLLHRVRSLVNEDEEVRFLAFHDTLSGLANRTFFEAQFKVQLRKARWASSPFALVLFDLNRFKAVNDTHGHQSGDFVLKAVAERLQNILRNTDVVARLGGDEFGIILPGTSNEVAISIVVSKVIGALEAPIMLPNTCVVDIGAAIGIVVCGTDDTPPEDLMHQADMAVYEAKGQGRSCYAFAPTLHSRPVEPSARSRKASLLPI